jgi:hypothetical protein
MSFAKRIEQKSSTKQVTNVHHCQLDTTSSYRNKNANRFTTSRSWSAP